jgi:hypothetical protein
MKATVKIEKVSENGSTITITAECETVDEVQQITKACREYTQIKKVFGVF